MPGDEDAHAESDDGEGLAGGERGVDAVAEFPGQVNQAVGRVGGLQVGAEAVMPLRR